MRKPDESIYCQERKPKTVEDDKEAKAVTAGTQGYYFPYGGGTKICPGRHFAKQGMMSAVAVFLREFDVELIDKDAASRVGLDMSYFPCGLVTTGSKDSCQDQTAEVIGIL